MKFVPLGSSVGLWYINPLVLLKTYLCCDMLQTKWINSTSHNSRKWPSELFKVNICFPERSVKMTVVSKTQEEKRHSNFYSSSSSFFKHRITLRFITSVCVCECFVSGNSVLDTLSDFFGIQIMSFCRHECMWNKTYWIQGSLCRERFLYDK